MNTLNFSEGCFCLNPNYKKKDLQEMGDGWTGWVQPIPEFGEPSVEIVKDVEQRCV